MQNNNQNPELTSQQVPAVSGGVVNIGTIDQGPGEDTIVGITATVIERVTWTDGADVLDSVDEITIPREVVVNTRGGDDIITGRDGIVNFGILETGEGNDVITGIGGTVGISNSGTIRTGDGDDTITGSGGVVGIENSGRIETGNGDDVIQGISGQFVDGGPGFDTAELGIDYDADLISIGVTSSTSIEVTFAGSTTSFDNLELWDFNGQEFTLEQIQELV